MREDGADTQRAIERDPAILRMCGAKPNRSGPKTRAETQAWHGRMQQFPAWLIDRDGAIGEVRLHRPDAQDCRTRLAIGLFSPALQGRGIRRKAIRLVLAYGFRAEDDTGLGQNRIDLRVLECNTRAIRGYSACGFHHKGRERQAARVKGSFHNDIIMGILPDAFYPAP